jgi:hypothetical protein
MGEREECEPNKATNLRQRGTFNGKFSIYKNVAWQR